MLQAMRGNSHFNDSENSKIYCKLILTGSAQKFNPEEMKLELEKDNTRFLREEKIANNFKKKALDRKNMISEEIKDLKNLNTK